MEMRALIISKRGFPFDISAHKNRNWLSSPNEPMNVIFQMTETPTMNVFLFLYKSAKTAVQTFF